MGEDNDEFASFKHIGKTYVYKKSDVFGGIDPASKQSQQGRGIYNMFTKKYPHTVGEFEVKNLFDKAVDFLCKKHILILAREISWAHETVKELGVQGFVDLNRGPELHRLKSVLWDSRATECIAIKRMKWFESDDITIQDMRDKFSEEQKLITSKIVAHVLTNGHDAEEKDDGFPYRDYGTFIPEGVQKQGPKSDMAIASAMAILAQKFPKYHYMVEEKIKLQHLGKAYVYEKGLAEQEEEFKAQQKKVREFFKLNHKSQKP